MKPKHDKDMGSEVGHLGGFRPGDRLPPSSPRMVRQLEIEILTIGPRQGGPLVLERRPKKWYREPFLAFKPGV